MTPGKQFEQLDMFKPASELKDSSKVVPGDFPHRPTSGWKWKLEEAKQPMARGAKLGTRVGPSLQDNIRENGIHWPVELMHGPGDTRPMLTNGHHRVAAAHDISPQFLVPVRHDEPDPRFVVPPGGAL